MKPWTKQAWQRSWPRELREKGDSPHGRVKSVRQVLEEIKAQREKERKQREEEYHD